MSFEKQHYFVMMMDMVVKMITVALFLGYQSIVLLERARAVIKESEKNGCRLKFFLVSTVHLEMHAVSSQLLIGTL